MYAGIFIIQNAGLSGCLANNNMFKIIINKSNISEVIVLLFEEGNKTNPDKIELELENITEIDYDSISVLYYCLCESGLENVQVKRSVNPTEYELFVEILLRNATLLD